MTYIDYFMRWQTEADAKADTFSLAQHFGYQSPPAWVWLQDHVLPNVQAWRPSQDIVSSGVTTHNYLTGWFAIVANKNQISVLLNSSQLAFALDRDGPPYVVKNNIGAIITDIACSPIFVGSHYPIGGYSS